jgi:4'-phosphopantetheinyl transferase
MPRHSGTNSPLDANAVHVWRVGLDQPAHIRDRLPGLLVPEERDRAARFVFDRDRDHYVVGRGVLRILLGRYLGLPPELVPIAYGRFGKPELAAGSPHARLAFNLAHSHGFALYAFAQGRRVGIDLERVRPMPDAESIAARFFSARERAALSALPAGERVNGFFRAWTRKEAFIKALGEGLSRPLDRFSVSLGPGEPARLLEVADDPAEAGRWTLRDLDAPSGFLAALAADGPLAEVTVRELDADGWCP